MRAINKNENLSLTSPAKEEETKEQELLEEAQPQPVEASLAASAENVIGSAYAFTTNQQDRELSSAPLVVEGRSIPEDKAATKRHICSTNRKVWAYLSIALLLTTTAIIVIVVLVIGRNNTQADNQTVATGDAADGTSNTSILSSWTPSFTPSTSYPSAVPSTGAPTTTAFDNVVKQLQLTDVSTSPESPSFRAIEWMANIDTLPPTLQRYSLVVFYYATDGENWLNQFGFLNASSHECLNWQPTFCEDAFSMGVLCYLEDAQDVAQDVHSLTFGEFSILFYSISFSYNY